MSRWGRSLVLPCVVLLAAGGAVMGCGSPQEPGVCHVALQDPPSERDDDEEEEDDDAPRMVRPVRPAEWLQLIVNAREGAEVTQECSGQAIGLPEPSRPCQEAYEQARREHPDEVEDDTPRRVAVGDESVVDRRLTDTRRLVWVITHRYPNGDGMGPIALVERRIPEDDDDPDELHVLAMGTLRARTERPRLRLLTIREPLMVVTERLICPEPEEGQEEEEVDPALCERREEVLVSDGVSCRDRLRPSSCTLSRRLRRELRRDDATLHCEDDEDPRTCWRARQLLVAEGETCEDEEDLSTCRRSAEFMFRSGDRFRQAELFHSSGRCLGRATMGFSDHHRAELSGGWRRDFSLAASYEFAGARMVIHQQVIARDSHPSRAEVPPRPFRAAEADLHWFPFQSRFVTPNESLWDRMLFDNASMELPPELRASAR